MAAWPAGTQIVITRLGVDMRGYSDIEVDVSLGEGPVLKTFRGCEYDPADGAMYAVCHEPLARIAFAHPRVLAKISAIRDGQRDRRGARRPQRLARGRLGRLDPRPRYQRVRGRVRVRAGAA